MLIAPSQRYGNLCKKKRKIRLIHKEERSSKPFSKVDLADMLFSSLAPTAGILSLLTALALAQDTCLETVKNAFYDAGVSLMCY